MALILKNKQYIKINLNGYYTIYKSKKYRIIDKTNPIYKKILQKYQQIIGEYQSAEYQRYHEQSIPLTAWIAERDNYCHAINAGLTKGDFPLMAKYFPEVNKSLPGIVETGFLGFICRKATLAEAYIAVKNYEIFGPKEEIKDA